MIVTDLLGKSLALLPPPPLDEPPPEPLHAVMPSAIAPAIKAANNLLPFIIVPPFFFLFCTLLCDYFTNST